MSNALRIGNCNIRYDQAKERGWNSVSSTVL